MARIELVAKGGDADLARKMLAFAAERMMEAEVQVLTGAVHGARGPAGRQIQRNGYREQSRETRAGQIIRRADQFAREFCYFHAKIGTRSDRRHRFGHKHGIGS